VHLTEHADAEAFLARAATFLAAAEAEHNQFYGVTHTLRTTPHVYRRGAWLATLEDRGEVVGTALHTPPQALMVSRMPLAACALIARARPEAAGVIGPSEMGEAVAAALGRRPEVEVRMRIHACEAVEPVPLAAGTRRVATSDDAIVLAWRRAFAEEIRESVPLEGVLERARVALAAGAFWLWEDDGPASMAALLGPTPRGIRVAFVYTPAERRGRGYATSLVAAITAEALRERRFCFLFTDVANPTSNAIYARIGYRAVTDVTHYRLVRPGA